MVPPSPAPKPSRRLRPCRRLPQRRSSKLAVASARSIAGTPTKTTTKKRRRVVAARFNSGLGTFFLIFDRIGGPFLARTRSTLNWLRSLARRRSLGEIHFAVVSNSHGERRQPTTGIEKPRFDFATSTSCLVPI